MRVTTLGRLTERGLQLEWLFPGDNCQHRINTLRAPPRNSVRLSQPTPAVSGN